ncbi:MAG TPA: hypothetical protein VNS09_15270 [Solirubrobacter sp.]|nr:hypothetical protein [Solirubrobacter sp.]
MTPEKITALVEPGIVDATTWQLLRMVGAAAPLPGCSPAPLDCTGAGSMSASS